MGSAITEDANGGQHEQERIEQGQAQVQTERQTAEPKLRSRCRFNGTAGWMTEMIRKELIR